MKLVLDVSNNDVIDLPTFRASGAVALIAKATEGTGFKDKTLAEHRDVAERARVPFGSYLFLHPNSTGSEAEYYLEYAKPRPGDLQPIIDAEVTDLGTKELARRTQACAVTLEKAGYRPILYASASIWQELILWQPRLRRLKVWEADYPSRATRWLPRFARLRVRLRHGVTVCMWQWTDSYSVEGRHYDASALLCRLDSIKIPRAL